MMEKTKAMLSELACTSDVAKKLELRAESITDAIDNFFGMAFDTINDRELDFSKPMREAIAKAVRADLEGVVTYLRKPRKLNKHGRVIIIEKE